MLDDGNEYHKFMEEDIAAAAAATTCCANKLLTRA
jgi:hypothetical protein